MFLRVTGAVTGLVFLGLLFGASTGQGQEEKKKKANFDVAGKVKSVAEDGKSFVIDVKVKKGEPAKETKIVITDKTKVEYKGVEDKKPAAGLFAGVKLEAGSAENAETVVFGAAKKKKEKTTN